MSGQQSQQLLGYLLGALEEDEHQQVEAQLRRDPALRAELARLRHGLEPLEESWQPVCPPPGLGQRTCRFVEVAASAVPRGLVPAGVARRGSWSLRDLVAAAVVLVAACLLLFPAVNRSRFQAAVRGCQDNLREWGVALKQFADVHNGCFPQVPSEGNEAFPGVYAAVLRDHGMLPDTRFMICPAMASQRQQVIYVPSCGELRTATPRQLAELRRKMSRDYGYHLGCMVNGRYLAVRDRNRSTFAIMADSPSLALDGEPSSNHGRLGQNVLFEDGGARFIRWEDLIYGCVLLRDPLFLNDNDEVAPGQHPDDAVIAPCCARPVNWDR